MGPDFAIVRKASLEDVEQVRLAEHGCSSDARRIDPISRSTWPFCHGERSAVG